MKQKIIIAATITILGCPAHANYCVLNPTQSATTSLKITGCKGDVSSNVYDTPQGNTYRFLSCTTRQCDSDMEAIPNPKQADTCVATGANIAIACGRVTDQWSAATPTYGYKKYEVCDEMDYCYFAWQYTCNQGYYGIPAFTAQSNYNYTKCTRCPALDGTTSATQIYGVVPASAGNGYQNYSVTNCYIPKDTAISDATGTFTYTENCFYSQDT